MSDTTVDFSPAAAPLAEKLLASALEIIGRYPAGRERSALLPLLHLVQTEEGHVSPRGVAFCAEVLGINKAQVGAVATFYTMYKRRPTGDYLVSVCTNTLCGMLGGDEVFAGLADKLGVGNNETTADGSITLEHAECLAACDYAPVVTVNYEFYDQQSPESAAAIVDALQAGERPLPTRGAALCTFKEIERQLAGFTDDTEAVHGGNVGDRTLAGLNRAHERGETAPSYDPDFAIPPLPEKDEAK
jgi:NADH-quinone oxidoreductase subunit E